MWRKSLNVKTLILIPTAMELRMLKPHLATLDMRENPVELCGFGPIAAAGATAHKLAAHQPDRVCLIGIAGSYRRDIPLGSALLFSSVSAYGIGVGDGAEHRSAAQLGWPQLTDENGECLVASEIEMNPSAPERTKLLTCCAASSDDRDVELRLADHSQAIAEDMEGFGVALACQLAAVQCMIVRGISNYAGDRNKSNWRIEAALESAVRLADQCINETVDREE